MWRTIVKTERYCSRKFETQSRRLLSFSEKLMAQTRVPYKTRGHAKTADETSVKTAEKTERAVRDNSVHFNPCKIQMISDGLFDQIFIDVERQKTFSEELINKCKRHLQAHKLWDHKVDVVDPIQLQLPKLEGINIDQHFQNIARQQTHGYSNLLDKLIKAELPKFPDKWAFQVGWTKYFKDGRVESVPFPEGNGIIFDVEVCMSQGQVPTLACAVSTDYWYSWCSPSLISGVGRNAHEKVGIEDLIPLETKNGEISAPSGCWTERIVVGHNVAYDRARIKEQYFLEKTKLRFMDTMSLHVAVSGITSFQRALKITMKSKLKKHGTKTIPGSDVSSLDWDELSSMNNLADVHKLYCKGDEINKDERNIFVKGTLDDVRNNFQSLALYCAKDVRATHEILQQLLPSFHERFPHPVTLCGMLEMGTAYLPVNHNWIEYIKNSEKVFKESEKEVKAILMHKATEALQLLKEEKYKRDPWLWDLDWKVPKKRKRKDSANSDDPTTGYPAWYRKLLDKSGDTPDSPSKISPSMQVVPKLLRLTWFGFPLHYSKSGKWGFLIKKVSNTSTISTPVAWDDKDQLTQESLADEREDDSYEISKFPYKEWEFIYESSKANLMKKIGKQPSTDLFVVRDEIVNKSEDMTQDLSDFLKGLSVITGRSYMSSYPVDPNVGLKNSPHPLCEFVPLPHKNGSNYKVGNPLGKDFLSKIEEGILSSSNGQDIADKVVKISKQASYWRNNRDRISGQMVVWFDNHSGSISDECKEIGAIIPQVVVAGTLTRRAVEATWLTASNAYVDRIGSELKSMVQAPPSYHFVGADVDSQELWIASVVGDAHFAGQHGCTALGWMTLQGSKSAGTDMHSKTASVSGIDREQAKVLNYARIYGAGVKFAERLLLQFNRNMSPTEARKKAKNMYKMTKGDRKYLLNEEGLQLASHLHQSEDHLQHLVVSKAELQHIMGYHQFPFREYMTLVEKLVWDNGTESDMFNRLEEIAQSENPQTPILGSLISRSLVPSVVNDDYMTSRVNWVVQSSAVDYLHLMLTCMGWLIKKFNIDARFSISVHDEVRYLVRSEDRYRLALALHITNLLTRSFCSYRLEMYDLPQTVAFFSCVDVDHVLRKEVSLDCVTPSNPNGLREAYNIPEGEALDIWKTIQRTGGSLLQK